MPRLHLKIFAAVALGFLLLLSMLARTGAVAQGTTEVLQVCAAVPDLGELAKEIGGNKVSVAVFTKGPEDPHFLDAKPGLIKILSRADLLIEVGMELEVGWLPVLRKNARNGRVLMGEKGHLDASTAVTPLDVPTGVIDRSMGDVHPSGNPHYLVDPLSGIKVARLIRDKLIELRPRDAQYFNDRYAAFREKMGTAMVGGNLAARYDFEKLALLYQHGKLGPFLKEQKEEALLGGWLGLMLPYHGTRAVADHNLWPYFARTFGISVVGFFEPKPGVPPTTKHLGELIAIMQKEDVRIILKTPYFDPKPADLVAQKTGARIVPMVHQTGALKGTDDYLAMVNHNVEQVANALKAGK
ncbi:MAG: metal ABC transporter substrate-binding protein [Syntrophobacteraceae bacterium]